MKLTLKIHGHRRVRKESADFHAGWRTRLSEIFRRNVIRGDVSNFKCEIRRGDGYADRLVRKNSHESIGFSRLRASRRLPYLLCPDYADFARMRYGATSAKFPTAHIIRSYSGACPTKITWESWRRHAAFRIESDASIVAPLMFAISRH